MESDNILREIAAEIERRPILAVDRALDALRYSRAMPPDYRSRVLELFQRAVLAEVASRRPRVQSINDPFDPLLDDQSKRFIAICFLRLLGTADEFFDDSELRNQVFDLFDRVLRLDIYKRANIEAKTQTFEKRAALEPLPEQVESDLAAIIASLTALDQLGMFRNRLMQALRHDLTRAIVSPFVPQELLEDARLGQIFGVLEEYVGIMGPGRLRIYERVQEVLADYRSEAEAFGTTYCHRFLIGLADKFASLIAEDFEKSGIGQPAQLEMYAADKKYPFHIANQNVELRIGIRNCGSGHAFDVELTTLPSSNDVEIRRPQAHLGNLEPGTSVALEIPALLKAPQERVLLLAELSWTNFDSSPGRWETEIGFASQRSNIDWDEVARAEPYSLESVETEAELVGRKEVLNQLIRMIQAGNITSSYVYGQKRVGKTSIVKVLRDYLRRAQPGNYLVLYLQGGDYVHPDPATTIERLGSRICREVRRAGRSLESLEPPVFQGALSPLAEYLDAVAEVAPDLRFLFILDEFDELPLELYQRGPIGDAFFLTLRTISGKAPFGFILVGGENMERIMALQGDRLNKFRPIRVDYFDREQHWPDFEELIRKPVAPWLEVSDEALTALYDECAGNPYFSKLIAGELFSLMVNRRDSYVTASEVREAARVSLKNVSENSFEHFWRDRILATGVEAEEMSTRRRRVLLALANALRQEERVRLEDVMNQEYVVSLDEHAVAQELRDFEQRRVTVERDAYYDFKVGFFKKWLLNYGVRYLIGSLGELDAVLKRKQQEEEAFVRSEEIVTLCENWGLYRGRTITEDRIRAWLRQFGDNSNQRLMFRMLCSVRFYTADKIRSKLKEAYGIVVRGLTRVIETDKRKRGDILVSYLDRVGKSGALYAKLFADENQIYADNMVERGQLRSALESRTDIQAVVFVDDFIGTGGSAIDYFGDLANECGGLLRERGMWLHFVAVCGFQSAQAKVQKALDDLNLPVRVHVCDLLDDRAKCFSDTSLIFPDPSERQRALNIAYEKGLSLEKRQPLGFGDCQAAVVYEHSCPNNALPILWAESKDWQPLFPRF